VTFEPAADAFLVALCVDSEGSLCRQAGGFCAGLALGMSPALILFSLYPSQFIFGTLTYNSQLYPIFCAANGLAYQMSFAFIE
jgi:hypothetical protein